MTLRIKLLRVPSKYRMAVFSLPQGAMTQSSAIEQLTTTITQPPPRQKKMHTMQITNSLTNTAKQNIESVNLQMNDMLQSMTDIKTASNNISAHYQDD